MNPSSPSSPPLHAFEREGNYRLSLIHSIRKPPVKPWRRSTALPDKHYVVHPSGFRKLVQKLTGAPQFTSRRLQEAAPAPLNLVPKRAVPPPQQLEYMDTYMQLQPLLLSPGQMKFKADISSLQLLPLFSPELTKFNSDTSSQLQPLFSSESMKFNNHSFGSSGFFSPSSSCAFPLLSPIFSPRTKALM
ncbi:uncharacterized protein LOC131218024 [Magnolia sinica]|uniref:uncharacterized protein LOC131218024 n=1 Tax=Magnolia sinica TaxID=86752 RepID=UPI002657B5BB|nr:uncharacterized protein LOC131218024 [Magnolia sinica]